MNMLIFIICFAASVLGALCGIGGGVIIKPSLDAIGIMDVATISFLSGCTVLSMSTYSVLKSKIAQRSHIEIKPGIPLALGASFGGILGKWIFEMIQRMYVNYSPLTEVGACDHPVVPTIISPTFVTQLSALMSHHGTVDTLSGFAPLTA